MKKTLYLFPLVLASVGFFVSPLHAHAAIYPQVEDVATDGTVGDHYAFDNDVSGDGRFVVFESRSDNIIPGAGTPNTGRGKRDLFLRDNNTGVTSLVNRAYDGSIGNDEALFPKISANGRYVCFESSATNLVTNDTNDQHDIFVRDLQTNTTQLVSFATDGTQADGGSGRCAISSDGRYVSFLSSADNLDTSNPNRGGVFLHDLQAGTTKAIGDISVSANINAESMSADGSYIAYTNSHYINGFIDPDNSGTYLYDRQTDTTELINSRTEDPHISGNGMYIAYATVEGALVYDLTSGITENDSLDLNGNAVRIDFTVAISQNGRYLEFGSDSDNLVPNDTNGRIDTFIRDRQAGITKLISVAADGSQANGDSDTEDFSISPDGHYAVFESNATNFAPNTDNGVRHVFLTINPFDPPSVTNSASVVGTITVSPNPVAVNTSASISANFTDTDTSDTHTATINWGDGSATQSGTVTESSGSGTVSGTHTYTATGSHTVTVTVTDSVGASATGTATATVIPATGLLLGNIQGADYSGANLSGQNMLLVNARGTNFTGANLSGATLTGANASGANFTNANLTNANLIGANLRNANFTGATLTGANLTGANVNGVIWSNTICPNGTNSNTHNNSCAGQGGGL